MNAPDLGPRSDEHRLALGLDYGTESIRALLVQIADGREIAEATVPYRHGVMDVTFLPTGEALPPDFALQHPRDYIEDAREAVETALERAATSSSSIVGVGIDFTACTPLPLDERGAPVCFDEAFSREKHAYVKLWKHHGANDQAHRMNEVLAARRPDVLARYGGAISSEWLFPKLLETFDCAPAVLERTHRYCEASDWVAHVLTGASVGGSCAAGYKGLHEPDAGYPDRDTLRAIAPELVELLPKLTTTFQPAGTMIGRVHERGALAFGIPTGVPVSAPIIDAHAAVPGCGVSKPGELVIILGTSACHMALGPAAVMVPGIQGCVRDGILPGFHGFEAGQAAFGDVYGWFVDRCLGGDAADHAWLTEEAAQITPGASGLLALDWWNGNRSILIDPELSGMIVGLTLQTRPAEIYRALIEATAFGTRKIVENFVAHGVPIDAISVCGGIAEKNPLVLRILADVTGRPIRRARSSQACALGAAIFGAAAAPEAEGGHGSVDRAVRVMAGSYAETFEPRPAAVAVYERLYREWTGLHDHFGRHACDVMHMLRTMRREARRTP
ncbi:MAG: ribulokinase [Planctomycetes bacterium]|nr:ribulokinase [Planctomycetota bacterium]